MNLNSNELFLKIKHIKKILQEPYMIDVFNIENKSIINVFEKNKRNREKDIKNTDYKNALGKKYFF